MATLGGRLEANARVLAFVKLANVALAMLWGFIVTYVFVRLLPLHEFKAFLLLVAFANFTISAEFGFSAVVYSRLRRHRIDGSGGFRPEELGVLLAFMALLVGGGGLAVAAGLAGGLIPTARPWLFLAFYAVSALNLLALLARRALAALDRNLAWELLDMVRRLSGIALLLLALAGLDLMDAVLLQLAIGVASLLAGLRLVHRLLGMEARHWIALRVGGDHVRGHYLGDIGRTMALTVSDVGAYNAPYATILLATADPRPLLLFDLVFKVSRGLSAVIRALTEAMLPRVTAAWHGGDGATLARQLRRGTVVATAGAGALGLALVAGGPWLSAALFDGKLVASRAELAALAVLLLALAPLCVSVYLQTGLGRFAALLPPSLALLAGSLLSVPVAAVLSGAGLPFALAFAASYAGVFVLLGLVHLRQLRRLAPESR
jgi:hypothetical protein